MRKQELVVVGCGGFGREVFSLVEALSAAGTPWKLQGYVDDAPAATDLALLDQLGTGVMGTVGHLARRADPVFAVVAVGSAAARRSITDRLGASAIRWATLIHPAATVGLGVRIGAGSVVAAGARLSTNVVVGRHVHIDQNATVGHDCALGDLSRLNPQACVSGSVEVGPGALIGANATVLPGLRVGDEAVVGAGAVVVRDVPSRATVKGVPAR